MPNRKSSVFIPYNQEDHDPLVALWVAKLSLFLFDEVILDYFLIEMNKDILLKSSPDLSLLMPTARIDNRSMKDLELFETSIPRLSVATFSHSLPAEKDWDKERQNFALAKSHFDENLFLAGYSAFHRVAERAYIRTLFEHVSTVLYAPIHQYANDASNELQPRSLGIFGDIKPVILDRILSLPTPDLDRLVFERIEKERSTDSWEQLRQFVEHIAEQLVSLENPNPLELAGAIDHALLKEAYREIESSLVTPKKAFISVIKGGAGLIPGVSEALTLFEIGVTLNDFIEDRKNWVSFSSRLQQK